MKNKMRPRDWNDISKTLEQLHWFGVEEMSWGTIYRIDTRKSRKSQVKALLSRLLRVQRNMGKLRRFARVYVLSNVGLETTRAVYREHLQAERRLKELLDVLRESE